MQDLYELIPESWRRLLAPEREMIQHVSRLIFEDEAVGRHVVPSSADIFKVLNLSPELIRVVIVGQDPYPNPQHAIGRAFAVGNSVKTIPGSLRNIMKERAADIGGPQPQQDLFAWERQGVMLLNRTLTTLAGAPNSHAKIGWESVTRRIVEIAINHGAVGLLWGRKAAELSDLFKGRSIVGVHPSPLSAHRGFFGSQPFSQTNRLLDRPIDW